MIYTYIHYIYYTYIIYNIYIYYNIYENILYCISYNITYYK